MKITSVNVHKFEKENSRMKGIAVVTLDDCFVVKGIRIIDGDNGLFIAMPSKTTATGEHSDIAHPINKETRQMFKRLLLKLITKQSNVIRTKTLVLFFCVWHIYC